jgi:hypothetical protein
MTVQTVPARVGTAREFHVAFVVARFFCLLFYFMQYAMRSAPGVMIPELTAAFGVSSLLGVLRHSDSFRRNQAIAF